MEWRCPNCSYLNSFNIVICKKCGYNFTNPNDNLKSSFSNNSYKSNATIDSDCIGKYGFFLFNQMLMDALPGHQIFKVISEALRDTKGMCAFNGGNIIEAVSMDFQFLLSEFEDGDVSAAEDAAEITETKDEYVVGMWSDNSENFSKLHNYLLAQNFQFYIGYYIIGDYQYSDFLTLLMKKYYLPQSLCLNNGSIVKGTAKYGIGLSKHDEKLIWASESGNIDDVKKAIADGADIDCIRSRDKLSPLFLAASEGYSDIVNLLIQNGANPNANNGVNTALMIACRRGHIDVVKTLIDGGANVSEKNQDGESALDNATEYPEITKLLKSDSKKWWQFWK